METEANDNETNNETNNNMNEMNEVNTNGTNGHETENDNPMQNTTPVEKKARTRKAQRPAKEAKERKAKKAKKAKAAPAPKVLEFAEPDKAGWRYAEGRNARFAIGASRHHGAEFALYSRTPDMNRFKLIAKFDALAKAIAQAEQENNAVVEAAAAEASNNLF